MNGTPSTSGRDPFDSGSASRLPDGSITNSTPDAALTVGNHWDPEAGLSVTTGRERHRLRPVRAGDAGPHGHDRAPDIHSTATFTKTRTRTNTPAGPDAHGDADEDADQDGHHYADADADEDAYPDEDNHADANSDHDGDFDRSADGDEHSDGNADSGPPDTDADFDSDADSGRFGHELRGRVRPRGLDGPRQRLGRGGRRSDNPRAGAEEHGHRETTSNHRG
jgi:hypothetical protein